MRLNDFHEQNRKRQHEAFAPAHSLTVLTVCVQEEVGELAAAVLGVTGEKRRKGHLTNADVLDAVADAITYLSLVAHAAGCTDLEKLLAETFNTVSDRAGSAIKVAGGSDACCDLCHGTGAEPEAVEAIRESIRAHVAYELDQAADHLERMRSMPGTAAEQVAWGVNSIRLRATHCRDGSADLDDGTEKFIQARDAAIRTALAHYRKASKL